MTRYQACRAIGLGPFSSALFAFLNFMANVPQGKLGICHMIISYDTNEPFQKGMVGTLEREK